MATTPFVIDRFGGLDVFNDSASVGAYRAVDMADVDINGNGHITTRSGYSQVVAFAASEADGFAVFDQLGLPQFIVGYIASGVAKYQAFNGAGGAAVATLSSIGSALLRSAQIASGGSEYLYLTNASHSIYRWDGSSFTSPAGMPTCAALAVTPYSFRLVAAGLPASAPSRVQFSDPGAPETWGANNWVDLSPGDGVITCATTWRDSTFVFKDLDGFYVFGQESVDSTGNPIFNFRAVTGFPGYDCVAGNEGVYFVDGRSVWLTTGDKPARISEPIEPFLRGDVSLAGFTVDQASTPNWRLSYSLERLYVSVTLSNGASGSLVFNAGRTEWTFYTAPIAFAAPLRDVTTLKKRTFWLSTTGVNVFDGSTTDNGSDIPWSYTSGKYPLSDPGRVAVTLVSSATGYAASGGITLYAYTDETGLAGGSALVGNNATIFGEGFAPGSDAEGKLFQHVLSDGRRATIERVTHYVSFVKPAGIQ
jgi:TM2 domain-containing membrane protein YozV